MVLNTSHLNIGREPELLFVQNIQDLKLLTALDSELGSLTRHAGCHSS